MSENQSPVERGAVLTYELNDDESLSEGIVTAVAEMSSGDPSTMDPLAETIDPDALDALFADQYDGTPRNGGRTEFVFLSYEIVVNAEGHVTVLDTA